MKNNRSLGFDKITMEMIKTAGPLGMQRQYRLITKVWNEHKIANDWHKGIIVPIYKREVEKM